MKKNLKSKFSEPKDAYCYALDGHRLSLEDEQLIAMDKDLSYYYVVNIIKKRFKLGEQSISMNNWYSYFYAEDILHSRFKLGEHSIANDVSFSSGILHAYIKNIFKYLIPLDFLELCPIKVLEHILKNIEVKNRDDVIKILFKKKLLSE